MAEPTNIDVWVRETRFGVLTWAERLRGKRRNSLNRLFFLQVPAVLAIFVLMLGAGLDELVRELWRAGN